MAKRRTNKERIYELAERILAREPSGTRYTPLCKAICDADPSLNPNTVNGVVLGAPEDDSNSIEKPSPGLYVLVSGQQGTAQGKQGAERRSRPEKEFYPSFAEWMERDIEEVTKAVELGGALFGHKWGTPDVMGKKEPRGVIFAVQMELISAEIKTNSNELVTAFGQACAYCLFSHRSYLVVPRNAQKDHLDRLKALCQVFGIGLVFFNPRDAKEPEYSLELRARRQEPDDRYLNQYAELVKDKLFK